MPSLSSTAWHTVQDLPRHFCCTDGYFLFYLCWLGIMPAHARPRPEPTRSRGIGVLGLDLWLDPSYSVETRSRRRTGCGTMGLPASRQHPHAHHLSHLRRRPQRLHHRSRRPHRSLRTRSQFRLIQGSGPVSVSLRITSSPDASSVWRRRYGRWGS